MKHLCSAKIITVFSIAIIMLYTGLSSCKKVDNPSNGIKDTITYDLQRSTINIQFIDAKTNQNVITIDNQIKVIIVGESKSAIADIIGAPNEEYIVRNGFLTLTILPEFTPSNSSPIRFSILYQLENYISSSKEITITNDGDYIVKIQMVNEEDPPDGVSIRNLSGVGNLYNGVLFDDVTISSTNGYANVTIPSGTKLMDIDTNNLSGKLNISLVYYDGQADDAFSSMPGGVASSILKNNNISPVVFFNAGIIGIEIYDVDFRKAVFIEEKSIEIDMHVPTGIFNPETGSNIKLGDEIQLFTYISDTGLWYYDGMTKVEASNLGGLHITTSKTNIGTYNFSNYSEVSCNNGSVFEIAGDCQQCGSIMLDGTVRKQRDNSFVSNISLAASWNQPSKTTFTTGNVGVYIDWLGPTVCKPCGVDPTIVPLLIDNMCSQQTIKLPLIDFGGVTASITANFSGVCASDTNIVILPSFGVWIRHTDSDCWRWASMKNGQSKICNLVYDESYIIGTYYNGIWKEWEILISDETIYDFYLDFPAATCSNIFGIL